MKLKKIFYVPGMFSALIVPLLLWYFGTEKLREPIPVLMDFGLPAKYNPEIPMKQQYLNTFEPIRNWDYKKLVVNPNSAKANSALYVAELRKLQKDNKKETGIEFVLNDENSYGDFASIINDFHIVRQVSYSVDLDKTGHLFAILEYQDPNEVVDNFFGNDVIYTIDDGGFGNAFEKNRYEALLDNLVKLPKNTFYIIFSFLILLNISVLDLGQKPKYH